ncbi:MAG: DUF1643 domain-containing protein [Planctomycetota bacterium]
MKLEPYRLSLRRRWSHGNRACWILLNPSTAEARPNGENDPTIRRCIGFSKTLGFGSMILVNIFAARATFPADLKRMKHPVSEGGGPANDRAIRRAVRTADTVIAAWGNHGTHLGRSDRVRQMLTGTDIFCLGVTNLGEPKHPLYLAADTPLVPFTRAGT